MANRQRQGRISDGSCGDRPSNVDTSRNNNLDVGGGGGGGGCSSSIVGAGGASGGTGGIGCSSSSVGGEGGASTGKQTSNIRLARASRGRGTRGFLKSATSEQHTIRNLTTLHLQLIMVIVVILL